MAYTRLFLLHPQTEQCRLVPVGFSWTVLFFFWVPMLWRGDYKNGGLMLGLSSLSSFFFSYFIEDDTVFTLGEIILYSVLDVVLISVSLFLAVVLDEKEFAAFGLLDPTFVGFLALLFLGVVVFYAFNYNQLFLKENIEEGYRVRLPTPVPLQYLKTQLGMELPTIGKKNDS